MYSLTGQEVSRLSLDYAVVLVMLDGTELRIETPFQFSSADLSQSTEVRPDRLDETAWFLVSLLRQQVASSSIAESGELSLRFARGQHLECPPDAEFEAWTLVTSSGERIVCIPGGGFAHWDSSGPDLRP